MYTLPALSFAIADDHSSARPVALCTHDHPAIDLIGQIKEKTNKVKQKSLVYIKKVLGS